MGSWSEELVYGQLVGHMDSWRGIMYQLVQWTGILSTVPTDIPTGIMYQVSCISGFSGYTHCISGYGQLVGHMDSWLVGV